MFWKPRNIIALVLILVCALSVPQGYGMLTGSDMHPEETHPKETAVQNTSYPITEPADANHHESAAESTTSPAPETPNAASSRNRFFGAALTLVGLLAGFAGVFLLVPRDPLLGPDLAIVLFTVCFVYLRNLYIPEFLPLAALLLSIRELWGWIWSRFSLDWCLCHRLGKLLSWYLPILSLFQLTLLGFFVYWTPRFYPEGYLIPAGLLVALLLSLACLLRWCSDLSHLQKQLSNLSQGLPTVPKDGTFREEVASLSHLQKTHQEAIQTAVTSERFKVELISNVSHDLRTPLTAILGYSELLQSEQMSPEARKKLELLHQKAEYMDALVESLFELTKVSSGVLEPKLASLDLIRLLEQTLGLFDDQLIAAGLQVRRHYDAEALPLITDGARLHQIFANLLGNAIKYALPGTRIHLEVRESQDKVLVRMVNIASYEMDFQPDEILQRFARGDKARSTKGSGLGLAIAQTYTESLGGCFRIAIDGDQFSAIVELPKN